MKKISPLIAALLLAFLSLLNLSSQTVTVNGRQLYVDGVRYRINGICYSRGGTGNYTQDIALMKEANINTIRTYSTINDLSELTAFANAGIKIIMHLDENNYEWYVNAYKNHAAILMWEFGNEFNYHPEWFGGDLNNWYTKLQSCATRVHQLDPNHPVTTAHGEVPTTSVLSACPAVDVWGLNLYRWDNNVPALTDFASKSSKAMYVSEAGGDSYNKNQNAINEADQALANKNILTGIVNRFDICAGVTMFEFCDEWWKAGSPDVQNPGGSAPNSSGVPYDGSADEEYWGIVRRDRSKKPAFYELKTIYTSLTGTTPPTYAAVPGKIEAENYIAMSGIQTENTSDVGGGKNVGWIDAGDWMDYNVNVSAAGSYTVSFRVAAAGTDNKTVQLKKGSSVLGSVTFSGTNGWQIWKTVTTTVNLTAGNQTLRVHASTSGFNLNWIDFTTGGSGTFSQKIESESYISMLGVQTENTTDVGGGQNVGWVDAGDWMKYSINIPATGTYTIEYRVASLNGGGTVDLRKYSGSNSYGSLAVPKTNGWQIWTTIKRTVTLSAGQQDLYVYANTGGFNINWFQISSGLKSADSPNAITEGQLDIKIYPNPVVDLLKIEGLDEMAKLEIYSLSGAKVIENVGYDIYLADLNSGVYIIKVTANNKVLIQQFIKR